ncbi:hypothetical protein [Candidatus Methanoperedens nitratireducens]|nr:hypothetical protein [Candidatus Methanoperedens nitroreducens]
MPDLLCLDYSLMGLHLSMCRESPGTTPYMLISINPDVLFEMLNPGIKC